MSVATHDLLAAAAIRINALQGTDPAELQVTYSTRPLIDEVFQSSIFPMNSIRDSLIQAQGKLARAIAFSGNHSARMFLRGQTAALGSGSNLPKLDQNSKPILGHFGEVKDQDLVIMTRMPVPVLRNRLQAPGIYLVNPHYYALAGDLILHTSTTVTLECCIYDAADQTDLFDQNADMTFGDDLAEAIICGGCAMLIRDDEWVEQSGRWAEYFQNTLNQFPPAVMEQAAA